MATSGYNLNDRVTHEVSSHIDSKGVWNIKVEQKPKGNYNLTHDIVYEGVNADGLLQFCLVPKGLKDKIATEDGDVSSVVGSSELKRKIDSQKGEGPMKNEKSKKEQASAHHLVLPPLKEISCVWYLEDCINANTSIHIF